MVQISEDYLQRVTYICMTPGIALSGDTWCSTVWCHTACSGVHGVALYDVTQHVDAVLLFKYFHCSLYRWLAIFLW